MVRSEVTLPNCSETRMKLQNAIMDLFLGFNPQLFLIYTENTTTAAHRPVQLLIADSSHVDGTSHRV